LALELRNVRVRIGGKTILQGISLLARRGEATVIVGPSGAGKTTLLRTIAGFLEPDDGEILLDGHSLRELPPQERGVALLSQRPVLLPHLRVVENIALAARLSRGLPASAARREAEELASLLGLVEVLNRKPAQLSGGQLQRASLAAVLAARPRILLLDEPFAHLDLPLREGLRRLVARIARERGVILLHVTHDQDEALETADSLAVLVSGRIEDQGPPARVYWAPATLETARFLGHNIACGPPLAMHGELASTPPEAVEVKPSGAGWVVLEAYRQRGRILVVLAPVDAGGSRVTLRAYIHPREALELRSGSRVGVSINEDYVRVWGSCEEG
jgi:ABC-type sugar transport system ATPase subunit